MTSRRLGAVWHGTGMADGTNSHSAGATAALPAPASGNRPPDVHAGPKSPVYLGPGYAPFSLHGLPVGVACFDSNLANTYANRRFAQLIGRSVPEIDGVTLAQLLGGAPRAELVGKLASVPPWRHARIEYTAPDPAAADGQRRFAFEQLPNVDGDGRCRGQWILITDVTDMLSLPGHDTAVAKTVGKFFSNMNHELRTPLNAVLGFAQVGLLESETSPNVRECFQRISEAGQQLLQVVSQLIDLSTLEAGAQILRDEVVMPSSIVERSVADFAAQAAAKGVQLVGESCPGPLPAMRGDGERLRQVLNTLVSNAVRFTDQGRVEVRAERSDDRFVLRVSDTGAGIDPAQLQRIFTPGSQIDDSYVKNRNGSGLGLAVADGWVKRMGGEIRVASEPDLGSVFEVRIPWRTAVP